jgi:hypothetical protein
MDAERLYRAVLTRPLTPERLKKAEARADTPAVWAAVYARLQSEGRLSPQESA